MLRGYPKKQGLYNKDNEHDSCGIGFVANIKGQKSHDIIKRGLEVLCNMTHRGAEGADNKTGDGAGILMQLPHEYFTGKCQLKLPEFGKYGVGMVFLPSLEKETKECQKELEKVINDEGLEIICWRDVAVNDAVIGDIAKVVEPLFKQVFVKSKEDAAQDVL
jgi:glutamate synthase (NADPH) large chain